MPKLSVEISANIDKFEKGIKDSEKGLKSLEKQSKSFDKGFSKNTQTASSSINKFSKSTANAVPALNEFSRIIQDAPFGIQGVANNITQLTTNFGYLSKNAGGTGAALKAMLKTLAGPAGILLAVSAVTSLMVSFGDKLTFATSKTKEFTDSLEGMSTKGIVEFKTLTDTILDVNASQKQQARAVEILREKYADFDVSLLKNKGSYDKAKGAIDAYIGSLVQQAKAQAALSLIEEKQAKILQIEEKKMLKIRNSFGAATIEGFEKRRKKLIDLNNKQLAYNDNLRKKREKQINARFDAVLNMNKKEVDALQSQIRVLTSLTNIRDLILFGDSKKRKRQKVEPFFTELTKNVKGQWLKEVEDINKFITNDNPIDFNLLGDKQRAFANFQQDLNNFSTNVKSATSVVLGELSTYTQEQVANLRMFHGLENSANNDFIGYLVALEQFNQNVKQAISGTLTSTFNQLGEAIGQSLASGASVVDSVGSVLLGSLGSLLKQVGQMAIAIGVGLKAIKVALKSLNPVAAIAAGVGLIALGSFFSSKASSIGGSIGSSGGGSASGSTGGSSFTPSTSSFSPSSSGTQRYVFEIAGTKLVSVLSNTLERNKSLGGSLQITT